MVAEAPTDERKQHKRFWQEEKRIDSLREDANALRVILKTEYAEMHEQASALSKHHAPNAKLIARFHQSEGTFRYKGELCSTLCLALEKICQANSSELQKNPDLRDRIFARSAEIRTRFPGFPAAATRNRAPSRSITVGSDLLRLIKSIHDPDSDSDPDKPEFPPLSPRYPATPTGAYEVLPNVRVLIKDESRNPTGSHKDRWAWEQLLRYKRRIEAVIAENSRSSSVPMLSMISSGSAAFALQTLLRHYGLPSLRVVMDKERTESKVIERLDAVGALVFPYDLDARLLNASDVLAITQNESGIDITTRDATTPALAGFYDWLVCEILVERPRAIFVPYGSGDLFSNIVGFIAKEQRAKRHDRRLTVIEDFKVDDLRGIHVFGATTSDPKTNMNLLYANFRPTFDAVRKTVQDMVLAKTLGRHSGIYDVTDQEAIRARKIARGHNIQSGLSGIAGLALFLKKYDELATRTRDKALIVNTGWMYPPGI